MDEQGKQRAGDAELDDRVDTLGWGALLVAVVLGTILIAGALHGALRRPDGASPSIA